MICSVSSNMGPWYRCQRPPHTRQFSTLPARARDDTHPVSARLKWVGQRALKNPWSCKEVIIYQVGINWLFIISDFWKAIPNKDQIRSDQLLSHVRLFATPWIAARQASLSITNSRSSLRLTSIESVMPSSHLITHPKQCQNDQSSLYLMLTPISSKWFFANLSSILFF